MKLHNRTLLYLSGTLLLVLTVWAVIFYVDMIDEVHDSIDDGLENSKLLIVRKAGKDPRIIAQTYFAEGNYAIRPAEKSQIVEPDRYVDTMMYMENEEEFEPVRLLTSFFSGPGDRCYQLKVISSMVEEDDLIEDLFYSLAWLYIVLIISILLINNFLLRSIWKPFYHLLNQLKSFKLGSQEIPEPVKTPILEFQLLNKTVTEVLQSNVTVFNNQKQLIENASHELQTPLAIALNRLQLFGEKHELNEEQMNELFQVVNSLERLARLNKSLLLLSRIENRQYQAEEMVDFNAICKELIADFEDVAAHKSIVIQLNEGTLIRKMNRDLAVILMTNLVKNALVHNKQQGTVEISIHPDELTISNTGINQSLDKTQIFDRFYKDTSEGKSTGLGLAIAKSVCEMYHIQISYSFSGMHTMKLSFSS